MLFNHEWMEDLYKLQQKAAELSQNQNSPEVIRDLVANVLKQWGIPNIPGFGDIDSMMSSCQNNNREVSSQNSDIYISENDTEITVRIFIPDIRDQNDLNIQLQGILLTITGKNNNFNQGSNRFERQVRLPAEVTVQGAKATYQNEVLTASFPKVAANNTEFIPVTFVQDANN